MYECTDASGNRSELARVIIACIQFPRDIRLTLAIQMHWSRMPFPNIVQLCMNVQMQQAIGVNWLG